MRPYLLTGALAALLLLCACQAQPPATPPTQTAEAPAPQPLEFDRPTFQLAQLPDLAPFAPQREIISRYGGEEFADTLQPAGDYGRLYPYEGKIIGGNAWESRSYWGLTDAAGRVVVDAVYQYAYYLYGADGQPTYLALSYPVAEDDAEAQQLLHASEGYLRRSNYQFASPDGRWVSGVYYGDAASISEDRIIISDYSYEGEDFWYGLNHSYRLYDLEGRLIATGQGNFTEFSEGLGVVQYNIYNEQTQQYESRSRYIDKNGRVAIEGPFLDARAFAGGRATVLAGEQWENRLYGVIDTQGNFIEEPSPDNYDRYYLYWEPYIRFYDNDGLLCGLTDKSGNTVVPAEYKWINVPYQDDPGVAVAEKDDGSYWLISLPQGECRQVVLAYDIYDGGLCGPEWCQFRHSGGMSLIKGDVQHHFPAEPGGSVYADYISGNLFALNYFAVDEQGREQARADVFDVTAGEIVKSLAGCNYNYTLNDTLLIFYNRQSSHLLVLDRDFEPAFEPTTLGNDALTSINHVADDVYSVRTTLFSGLIRENGQWLVRVYINNTD